MGVGIAEKILHLTVRIEARRLDGAVSTGRGSTSTSA